MKVTIYNEQGLLEVEAEVDVEPTGGWGGTPIAEVKRVWVEGVRIPLSALSDYLLEELEEQALEEV